MKALLIKNYSS